MIKMPKDIFIGAIFAFIRPEGPLIMIIFLIIALGWIIFLIKYFWELMDKDQPSKDIEA